MEDMLKNQRHSAAHLLAMAVLQIHPNAKLGIGPVIDNGFYYDFQLDTPLTPDDLPVLEQKMLEIIQQDVSFDGREVSREEAKDSMSGQPFKIELIDDLPENEPITLYKSGSFTDLCRGGHVTRTGEISSHFKLTSLAGAYWRGDENRPMLQRVYGVLFTTKGELDGYLTRLEEAKKRDHRKLGQELDLFTFSDLIGPGLPLFTPRGTVVREQLNAFLQSLQIPAGYERVTIPHIAKPDLYKTSGHWDKFKDDLFHVTGKNGDAFVLKPMNCPHHNQIYAAKPRSYRDLPIRYAEVTTVYRDEQTGELNGLSRVRAITQDDAHVYCTLEQVNQEVMTIYGMIRRVYTTLSMPLRVRLSLRDPDKKENYLGDETAWNDAESRLRDCLKEMKEESFIGIGEAAFYGPKLDFMATDALGREWQVATVQLDFVQPERFKLVYTDADGAQKQPVMIHRAILGSLERFMAILIEHYAGDFPLWLAPVQVAILPVSDKVAAYASVVEEKLSEHNIRVWVDASNESIGKKIRSSELQKYPIMLIVGEKEEAGHTVSVRSRLKGDEGLMTIDELVSNFNFDLPS